MNVLPIFLQCSVTCGGGIQHRIASCIDHNNNVIDVAHCFNSEKITEQFCNVQKCPIWKSRDWTPCSATCGQGFRTKPYFCLLDGRVLSPSACDSRQKRIEKEECIVRPCAEWSVSSWSECSVSCGEGVQTRNVFCKNTDDRLIIKDHFCPFLKPNTSKVCNAFECVKALPYQKKSYDYANEVTNSISSFK